ncbi:hypothetical protein IWW48_001616 [Coemansia sp. RSA 1200]|nr:hypothetical protein IWW48_001616 [Coemansia sp. RSA 1200]
MSMICDAPVYRNVVGLSTLATDKIQTQSPTNDAGTRDVCVVATEDGHVSLVYIEELGGRCRFRQCDEIMPSNYSEQGLDYMHRPLQKIISDPCSRAIGIVTWSSKFELLLFDWASIDTQWESADTRPLHRCVGLHTHIGDQIFDAAILAPSDTEPQRILVVAASAARESYSNPCLGLYETWGTSNSAGELRPDPSLKLLESLPFSMDTRMPLYLIALPAFPECFLLLMHNEVVFVSSSQILSGDVFLHRVRLPETSDNSSYSVMSFCVAGTAFIYDKDRYNSGCNTFQSSDDAVVGGSLAKDPKSPRSPASFGKRSPHLSDPMLVQKLYLTTEAGQLFRVYVSSKPFIDIAVVSADSLETGYRAPSHPLTVGNTLLYLGSDGESEAPVDRLFANGDCDDHSIIRVSEHLDESSSVQTRPVVRQQMTSVLENHCPVTSIVLRQDSAYWTSGRGAAGYVQQAQFGHIVQVETILDVKIDDDQVHGGQMATRLWALNNIEVIGSDGKDEQLDKQRQAGDTPLSHVVLYNEWSGGVCVVENQPGDWNVDDRLAHVTSGAGIVLMCKLVNTTARNGLLLINRHRIEIIDVSLSDENVGPIDPADTNVLLSALDGEVFVHGACCHIELENTWLVAAAVYCRGKRSRVITFSVETSYERGFEEVENSRETIDFDSEIACIRSFAVEETAILLVGTHDCKIHTYRLDDNTDPKLVLSLNIAQHMGTAHRPYEDTVAEDVIDVDIDSTHLLQMRSDWIPNDVYLLYSDNTTHILAGLRDGHILSIAVSSSAETLTTTELVALDSSIYTVGQSPVSFADLLSMDMSFTNGHKSLSHLMHVGVIADMLYIACLEDIGLVRISPCFGRSEPLSQIRLLVPIDTGIADTRYWRCFAVHRDGNASVLWIPFEKQCYLRDFHVGGEPRHLVFDEDTGLIVVAGHILPTSALPNITPTSYLRLLDPCDGGQVHTEIRLRSDEMVQSLVTWHIHGQRRYRYICVGTELCEGQNLNVPLGRSIPKPKRGRLIIYNLKTLKRKNRTKSALSPRQDTTSSSTSLDQITGKGGYELKYVWESEREDPVVALASMGDSYLVVGTRKMCVVLRLDVVQKQLIECCETPLRFPVTGLQVRGYDVVVSSEREAVHILRFVPAQSDDDYDRLILKNSARFGSTTMDACYLSSSIIAGVGYTGCLYGVRKPSPSNTEFGIDPVFGIHLGTECSQIRQGCLVKSVCRPNHVLPWTDDIQLDKQDDHAQTNEVGQDYGAVVTTVSGTMWTLVRISSQAFDLLKELERAMCAFGWGHPARPLLAPGGSVDRARRRTSIRCSNVIDGTVSTAFVDYLTLAEQLQVVASSDELQRLALTLDIDIVNLDHEADILPTQEHIVQIICKLIWTINTTCVC